MRKHKGIRGGGGETDKLVNQIHLWGFWQLANVALILYYKDTAGKLNDLLASVFPTKYVGEIYLP